MLQPDKLESGEDGGYWASRSTKSSEHRKEIEDPD